MPLKHVLLRCLLCETAMRKNSEKLDVVLRSQFSSNTHVATSSTTSTHTLSGSSLPPLLLV